MIPSGTRKKSSVQPALGKTSSCRFAQAISRLHLGRSGSVLWAVASVAKAEV
jgi:hypothetical protein